MIQYNIFCSMFSNTRILDTILPAMPTHVIAKIRTIQTHSGMLRSNSSLCILQYVCRHIFYLLNNFNCKSSYNLLLFSEYYSFKHRHIEYKMCCHVCTSNQKDKRITSRLILDKKQPWCHTITINNVNRGTQAAELQYKTI